MRAIEFYTLESPKLGKIVYLEMGQHAA